MATKVVTRTVKLYIDDKEIDNSVKSIKAEVKLLTAEMNKMTIGSDEYNAHMRKISQLNGILDKHKSDLKGVGTELDKNNAKFKDQSSIFSNLSSNFGKYAAMFTGFLASMTSAIMIFNKNREDMKVKDSAAANLKALTGLDDESIGWLTKQAEILSTTMDESGLRIKATSKEILEAYTLVGSAKPELLTNKEALNQVTIEALRMATASKMEVKDAVEGLTLAMNQYGASANEAAKYVNVLAAGAKFGSAEIANQTIAITKAGVAASTSKIPIEGLVGAIQTLAEKGIKDEIAGTGMKSFFLKLEAGAKDTRPSVVGLGTALQRLKAENLDANEMIKRFGLETYTVAQALISNADKVDYYTKAVTNTNAATEQAAINSETSEAKEAQLKNKMTETGIVLATMLNPAYMESLNIFTKIITAVPIIVEWFIKYKNTIIIVAAELVLYNIAAKASIVLSQLQVLWTEKIVAGLRILYATMMANPWTAIAVVFSSIIAVFASYTDSAYKAIDVTKKLNEAEAEAQSQSQETIDTMNQYLSIARDDKASKEERLVAIKKLNEINPEYLGGLTLENINTMKASNAIDLYTKSIIANAKAKVLRSQIEEIEKKKQEILTNDQTTWDDYITVAVNKVAQFGEKFTNALKSLNSPSGFKSGWNEKTSLEENKYPTTMAEADLYRTEIQLEQLNKAEEKLNRSYIETTRSIIQQGAEIKNNEEKSSSLKNKAYWSQRLQDLTAQYDALSSAEVKSKKGLALAKEIAQVQKEIKKYDLSASSKNANETAERKEVQKKLDAIDAEYLFKKNNLLKAYNESLLLTEEDYQNELEKIEREALEKKLTIAGLEPAKRYEISQQIFEAQKKLTDKIKELMKVEPETLDEKLQSELDANKKNYEENLSLLEEYYKNRLDKQQEYEKAKAKIAADRDKADQKAREKDADAKYELAQKGYSDITTALREQRIRENLTDAQYDKISKDARLKFLKTQLKNENLSASKRQEIIAEANDIELQEQEDALSQRQDLQEQYNKIIQDSLIATGQLLGEQLGDILKNGTINLKEFLRGILSLIIDAVEKAVLAARAASLAKNLSLPGLGLVKWGFETALLTSAFEVAKAAVANFYDGGFTPSGTWNQPQGIVHSNEFVANRFATSNPSLLPVLNLIDVAQKSGSVANLSSTDIAAVLPYSSRANSSTVINNSNTSNNMAAMAGLLVNVHKTLNQINKRFSMPIIAETYASGKHGTIEATDLVNKMKSNVSRQL